MQVTEALAKAQAFNIGILEQGLAYMESEEDAAKAEELRRAWERSMQNLVNYVESMNERFKALPKIQH